METNTKRNKEIAIVAGIVLAVVAGYFIWQSMLEDKKELAESDGTTEEQTEETDTQEPTRRNRSTIAPDLSYEQAFEKYQGRLLTFDANCVATPRETTFKNSTEIMVDNRSGSLRRLSFDGVMITLDAYDFTIINLSTKAPLPHEVVVNCDSARNVINLLLQN